MADQTEMMDKLLKSNSEQPVQEKIDILIEILKLLRERTGAALVPEEVSPIVRERTGAAPSELEIQSIIDLLKTETENPFQGATTDPAFLEKFYKENPNYPNRDNVNKLLGIEPNRIEEEFRKDPTLRRKYIY